MSNTQESIKFSIRNGMVYNEYGAIIAVLTDNATKEDERVIQLGSEAIPVMENFVETVNSGKFKPKSVYNTFTALLKKYK